ncbi:MAG: hypothetical protein HGA37_13110 [Lentimicrobium sp.]|nr:hypothetical protein [Lentimicrobium sp.]
MSLISVFVPIAIGTTFRISAYEIGKIRKESTIEKSKSGQSCCEYEAPPKRRGKPSGQSDRKLTNRTNVIEEGANALQAFKRFICPSGACLPGCPGNQAGSKSSNACGRVPVWMPRHTGRLKESKNRH